MKIKTYGFKGYTGQLSRIEQGFVSYGHVLVNELDQADLVYCNNLDDEILEVQHPKKIVNILDIPEHLLDTDFSLDKLNKYIDGAYKVTCISGFVKRQIKKYLGVNSQVILNPVKDVFLLDGMKKDIDFLYVGRAGDPNKRFNLAHDIAVNLNKKLIVCGTESVQGPNIQHVGVVDDLSLCQLYNRSKFTLLPSKLEGLGLPMLEASICGSIPICCNDNETAREFLPSFCYLSDPEGISLSSHVKDIESDYENYRETLIKMYGHYFYRLFNKCSVAKNILDLADA